MINDDVVSYANQTSGLKIIFYAIFKVKKKVLGNAYQALISETKSAYDYFRISASRLIPRR